MSVISDVYSALKIRVADRCPSIKDFGLWNSQGVDPANDGAYNFPALFVHFQNVDDNEDASSASKGVMRIALHIQFSETYQDDFPDFLFPVIDEVHRAVHGWSIPCAGPFRRRNTRQDDDHSNFQDWIVEYEGPTIDDSVIRGDYDDETALIGIRLVANLNPVISGVIDPPSDAVVVMASGVPAGLVVSFNEGRKLAAGTLHMLLSAGAQQPDRNDGNGENVLEFADAGRFTDMNIYSFRFYMGDQSFLVETANGPDFQFVVNDLLTAFPNMRHDITFPPQLDHADIPSLYHGRVNTFVLGNEPPNNVEAFEAVGGYTAWAIATYDAAIAAGVPAAKIFIQTGKPEFFDTTVNPLLLVYPPEPALLLKHTIIFAEAIAAIIAGDLPPRIVTTHKRFDEERDTDLYPYYERIIQYYIDAVGPAIAPDLRINFQEFKWKNFYGDNIHLLLYYVEMICIMSRLREQFGAVIHGLTLQQGYSQPKGNLIDLFNPANPTDPLIANRTYQIGIHGEFFLLMQDIIANGEYVFSDRTNTPTGVEIEFYDYAGSRRALYVNKLNIPYQYSLSVAAMVSVSSNNNDYTSFDHVFTISNVNMAGLLPAKTCGIITLN